MEYGSELHSTLHGSAFPSVGRALNPGDPAAHAPAAAGGGGGGGSTAYTRSPWNLTNLNAHSLLRHVREDIPGVMSPWVYVGMLFRSGPSEMLQRTQACSSGLAPSVSKD